MLNRLSILQRLLMVSLLPLAAAILLAAANMHGLYEKWQADSAVIQVVAIKPAIGKVVMELQRERGLSAMLLAGPRRPEDIRAELAAQRPRTDAAIQSFHTAYAGFLNDQRAVRDGPTAKGLNVPLAGFARAVSQVGALRTDLTRRHMRAEDVLAGYNEIIDTSYEILDTMILLASDTEVARRTQAFSGIVRARNHVGLERARGGMLMLAAAPTRDMAMALTLERGRQAAWLDMAASMRVGVIPPGIAAEIDTELGPMRAQLLDPAVNAGFTARQWFAAASRKVEALASVRNAAIAELRTYVLAAEERARHRLELAATLTIAAILLFLTVFYALLRGVRTSLSALHSGIHAMASGEGSDAFDMSRLAPEFKGLGEAMTALGKADAARRAAERRRAELERAASAYKEREHERERAGHIAQAERVARMNAEILRFESRASEMMRALENAALALEGSARELDQIADSTRAEAQMAHHASDDASMHVQAVSIASEGLAMALGAIRQSIDETSTRASRAAAKAGQARARAEDLATLAVQIDLVVSVIDDIAVKTNFLALNATIEAAMAGASQGGFGVIAHELKELTKQTAFRAGEINALVESAKEISTAISEGIGGLEGTARSNSARTADLARNIADHGGAAREMSLSMRAAAEASQSVAGAARRVSAISEETRSMSGELLGAAETVTRTGAEFREVYENFVSGIRAI